MIDDLLAPVDIARFALAYVLLIVAPGYAVVTLLRTRSCHVERLALAIPCGYALVVLCGLCTTPTHLPFGLATYVPCAVPITLWGGYALCRGRGGEWRHGARWAMIPVGVGALQATLLLIAVRHAIPAVGDIISHVIWTDLIARAHVFPIALLSAHAGDPSGGFYPPAFHAVTALVLAVAPMQTYHAVVYSVLGAVALLPLGLYCYVRAATGSARIGAYAALAALAFAPLPFFVGAEGLCTFTVSQVFVPALAIALYAALVRCERGAIVLAAVIGAGFFYTHPTEFVTAGLLSAAIVPIRLCDLRAWARACRAGVVIAASWLGAAAPALAAVHRTMAGGAQTEISVTHDFATSSRVDVPTILWAYGQWLYGHTFGFLLLAAITTGTAWCLVRRQYLHLVVVEAIVVALALDSESYNLLRPFYVLSFPWALWERIAATHYWFVLPVAAIGLDAATRAAGRQFEAKKASFVALSAAPFVVIGLLLPLTVSAWRAHSYAHANSIGPGADTRALMWLAGHGAARDLVVNDTSSGQAPIDSSMSLPLLGGPQPLFARLGGGPGSREDRVYVLRHIADDPLPPRAMRYIETNAVRYVFYGSHTSASRGNGGYLDLAALLASPHLRLVYSSVSTCGQQRKRQGACPTTGAYIFARR